MFELSIEGLTDKLHPDTFIHQITTHDFLEVVCQIAEVLSPVDAGNFTRVMLVANQDKLSYLRVEKFEVVYKTKPSGSIGEITIRLRKVT